MSKAISITKKVFRTIGRLLYPILTYGPPLVATLGMMLYIQFVMFSSDPFGEYLQNLIDAAHLKVGLLVLIIPFITFITTYCMMFIKRSSPWELVWAFVVPIAFSVILYSVYVPLFVLDMTHLFATTWWVPVVMFFINVFAVLLAYSAYMLMWLLGKLCLGRENKKS